MRMLSRRYLLLGALVVPLTAHAQNWPAGNIKIVVVYPPGGSTDMIARLIQPHMQQRLGTTVIIENRAGGGGSIGTAAVAKSSPDGSTWAMVFDNHAANPFVFPNMPFNTEKDLDPVQLIGTAPYVLSTNAQKPFKTLAEVVAAAKTKPGTLSYATVGAGSVGHLAMELLWKQAGVRLVHVPYRGGGPAMNDLIAGHVDLFIASTAAVHSVHSGRLDQSVGTVRQDPDLDARECAGDRRELSRVRGLCLVGRLCACRHAQGDRQQVRRRACRVVARTGRRQAA